MNIRFLKVWHHASNLGDLRGWQEHMTCLKFMGLTQPVAGYPQMVQKDEIQGLDICRHCFFWSLPLADIPRLDLDAFTNFWATYWRCRWIEFMGQQQKTTWIGFIRHFGAEVSLTKSWAPALGFKLGAPDGDPSSPWNHHHSHLRDDFPQNSAGWWFFAYPSERHEFVNWDDDIPNWMEK